MPIEFVDRYAKTFRDFCCLGPRKFNAARNNDPSKYLSPYQLLVVSLSIGFLIFGAAISLSQSVTQADSDGQSVPSPDAIAVYFLAFAVTMLFVNSLIFRAISRIWPIRGSATFRSIFELECYTLAIRMLPPMVLTLVLLPLVTVLMATETVSNSSGILILVAPAIVITLASLIFLEFPGIAAVNEVSTGRVWAGFLFWPTALGALLGFVTALLRISMG